MLTSAAVPLLCVLGAGWPLLATVVVVVAAVLDGVDGALASQTGSATRWGRVLDPLADRCSDLLLVLALVVLGAPGWLGALLGALTLLLESVRATGQVAGMQGPGVVTVWERPSRVIVAAFGLAGCGALWISERAGADLASAWTARVATTAAVVGAGLAVWGLARLLVVVRRALG